MEVDLAGTGCLIDAFEPVATGSTVVCVAGTAGHHARLKAEAEQARRDAHHGVEEDRYSG